ncbi:polysaccharide deacetylase family protein [Marivirga arenosa]|uniref:Polysaccharide deacetylase family protein n=1 Tax=Marivirga arenosa TaxID=3059076 RepID=A0AA51R6M6_9BACT|nr:polysaccharide deacetylase family protein [Marivirga sp. ABR2-2]WMN06802.1 polysaccharide deacetylase family protein [Marivirga sp. ABR2-2]
MNSIFTISLDFELHWGGFEKWPLDKAKKQYFLNTRKLIPQLLDLFEHYEVHVSWATVGLLMHENKNQVEANFPDKKPSYDQKHLSAYHFLESVGIGENEQEDPYHYADSLIKDIISRRGQELASHSFAHYYCNEKGQTLAQFDADCKAITKASEKYEQKLRSLVFPRNQFNADYLKVCSENGIKIIRSNPVDWWWDISDGALNESKWKRLNRGLDAYFNIGGKTSYGINAIQQKEGVYLLPASRLLRPYNPKELFLNKKKINRIKKEMTIAAQKAEFYHLWWHPHNFGNHSEENLDGLREILTHFSFLQKEYGMKSLNMGEIAEKLEDGSILQPKADLNHKGTKTQRN